MTGILRDTSFAAGAALRLEVLETGDTLSVAPGKPFRIDLPRDTVWNLCFSAPVDSFRAASQNRAVQEGGISAQGGRAPSEGRLEKCFEVRLVGNDTAFSADIGDQPSMVVQAPRAAAPIAAAPDSVARDTGATQYKSEEAVQLKKVLVRAQRAPKRSLGKSTVSAKLIKRMPGLAEADVIRSIQALPGVVASSDFSTKIYVRGGGSDQNLILLDKAVVYSPVHFFGLFSTFLVEGIDEVNFYKGGFPPEYGNRLSSVLDIKSREGGTDSAQTWEKGSSLQVSTFASQIHTEGHQGPVRWLVAGRRTYIDQVLTLLRDQGLTDLDLDYYFYDLQGNVHYDMSKNDGFMLSWYNGRDELNFTPFKVDWGNTVIPLNYDGVLDKHLTTHATASYSLFSQDFSLEHIFAFYNRIATINYKQSLEYTGIDGHRLTAGLDLNWIETIFRNDQIIAKILLRDRTTFFLNSLFFEDKWSPGATELTGGLRLTQSTVLDVPGVEPRLSLKYKLPHAQALDFHVGFYQQYVNSIQFSDQESINEFYYPAKKVSTQTVNPTSSLLFSAGYGIDKVKDTWDFTLEGYFKTVNHLPVYSPNDVPDSILLDVSRDLGDLFREANGYSYGFEASLRKPEGLIFGGLSYSNGTAVIREDAHKDQAYFPSWHQPHSLKADLAINLLGKDGLFVKSGRKYLRMSSQLKYATGLPYTEYVGYSDAHLLDQNQGRQAGGPNPEFQDNIDLLRGNRNAAFVPAYFRWDLKPVDWGREGKWNFSWTLLNITDHKNIFFYTYDRQANPPKRIEITQFPFFPFLVNYEYYF
ncbi:MAG: TonB-dependent receptor plug domain-containing protein [Fibrobacteres bacterium]|nr:TonB-dependent receptor plug domain-containing protein [Fibrobacterota bacterium]